MKAARDDPLKSVRKQSISDSSCSARRSRNEAMTKWVEDLKKEFAEDKIYQVRLQASRRAATGRHRASDRHRLSPRARRSATCRS